MEIFFLLPGLNTMLGADSDAFCAAILIKAIDVVPADGLE
jgi:hypothetical protein